MARSPSSTGFFKLRGNSDEVMEKKYALHFRIGGHPRKCTLVDIYEYRSPSDATDSLLWQPEATMKAKLGGYANVVHAWYTVATKAEFFQIIEGGSIPIPPHPKGNLHGLHLGPDLQYSFLSTPADADGLKYFLLCRVILGRTEVKQSAVLTVNPAHPNSEYYDSAVLVSLGSPVNYVVWYPNINTHILPLCAFTVKVDIGSHEIPDDQLRQQSMSFVLVNLLEEAAILPDSSLLLMIKRLVIDLWERSISWEDFLSDVLKITCDNNSNVKNLLEKENNVSWEKFISVIRQVIGDTYGDVNALMEKLAVEKVVEQLEKIKSEY